MLGAQDFVLEVDNVAILIRSLSVLALPVQSKGDVVAGPKGVRMFGSEHLLPDREDPAMLSFRFGGFASVIERNGETVLA